MLTFEDEVMLADYIRSLPDELTIVVAQGFEERTCGILKVLSDARVRVKHAVVARYKTDRGYDNTNTEECEMLSQHVAPNNWDVIPNYNDGDWALSVSLATTETVLVDITGISNRAMFRSLDHLENS